MRGIRNLFSWKDMLIVISYSLFFIILCNYFINFTLDDAYITFRYSQNLANGYGPVWNICEDPVEGFTSFLWMLLMAISIKLGLNPVTASKLISIIAGLSTIFLIYFYSRLSIDNRIIPALAVAGIALNPAFALLTVQGMETTLAALLVLCTVILSIRLASTYSKFETIIFSLLLLLAFLTRPDLVAFDLVLLGCMIIVLYRQYNKGTFYNFLFYLFIFSIIPGIAYMVWRINYFGYLFPNTFYVKASETFLSLSGMIMVFSYLISILIPYILLVLCSFIKANQNESQVLIKKTFPALLSLFLFLALHFFIDPVQGFLFRFQMPTLPSFLLLFSLYMTIPKTELSMKSLKTEIKSKNLPKSLLILLLCFLLIVFPLHTLDDAIGEKNSRTQFDRVVMGEKLAKLADKNYTMFATESGALPYYSKWKAVDYPGLNTEYIAHKGLTIDYLEKINPELVMAVTYKSYQKGDIREGAPELHKFLVENDYIALAAIKKTEIQTHLYFVKPGNSSSQIAQCVLNIPTLEYRNIYFYVGDEIPIWNEK